MTSAGLSAVEQETWRTFSLTEAPLAEKRARVKVF